MNNQNFFLFNFFNNLNISVSNSLKLFFILFLILVNIYLMYLEFKSPNKSEDIKYMQSGIDGKFLRNIGAIIVSNVGLYASILTIKDHKFNRQQIAEAIEKDKETLLKIKNELIESKILRDSLRTKVTASVSRLTEVNNTISSDFNTREKIVNSICEKEEGLNSIAETKVEERNSIMEELKLLKKNIVYRDAEIKKSINVISNESKNLETILKDIGSDISKSSILNPFSFLDSFEVIDKIAICILLLNNVILSGLISIVFIFYGDILIEKYKLEEKYPRLATIIRLRRKFQRYYLLLSILFILVASLSQIIFSLVVLAI
jgi:hypothetical protein